MKGRYNADRSTQESGVDSKAREVIAYALGHTETWLRWASERTGIPYETIANGLSELMAQSGNRVDLSVPQVREASTRQPRKGVLRSTMALGRGARKHVQSTKQEAVKKNRLSVKGRASLRRAMKARWKTVWTHRRTA
jgi:hypothetical protein